MQLGCPMTMIYATKDDEYRKPKKGMWDFFVQQYNQGQEPGTLPQAPTTALSPHRPPCCRPALASAP